MFHPFVQSLSGFDPATISGLTALYRNFASTPWAGGSPGGNMAASSGTVSASTLNGHGTCVFGGAADLLSANATSSFFGTSSLSGWVLFNPSSFPANDTTNQYNDACLLATNGTNQWVLYVRGSGASGAVGMRLFNTTGDVTCESATTISTSTWALVQYTYDGTTMRVRVNGNTFATATASGGVNSLAASLRMGENSGTVFYSGTIAEAGMANVIISNTTFDQIRSYCASHYGVTV